MPNKKLPERYTGTKQLIIALSAYASASIFGPLILIGGAGYLLDRALNTKPIILIISIIIAFIVTNILIYKKAEALSKLMDEQASNKT